MDAFVALTGLDETNNHPFDVRPRRGNTAKVIAKVNRPSFAGPGHCQRHAGQCPFSTSTVTTEAILQYVRAMQNTLGSNIKALHRIVGGQVEALEFGRAQGRPPLPGVPLKDLPIPRGGPGRRYRAAQRRGPSSPPAATRCSPGDDVVVCDQRARASMICGTSCRKGGAR